MPRSFDPMHALALGEAFDEIMSESPDGIIVYSPEEEEGRVGFRRVFLNRSAERMLGESRKKLIGGRVDDQSVGPFARDGMAILSAIYKHGGPLEREIEVGRGSGFRAFRVRGRRTGTYISVRLMDISESVIARREIGRREAILQGVADAGRALIHGSWSEVLDQVLATLGEATGVTRVWIVRESPESDDAGASPGDLDLDAAPTSKEVAEWRPAVPAPNGPEESDADPATIRIPITVRDEPWGVMAFEVNGEPRAWSRGEMEALESACALLGAAIEREMREAEIADQLWQAQKLDNIGRLAGGVAHDFNNLLTVVRGNVDLARQAVADGEAPERELAEVARAAERGSRLSQQLLAFSRRQVLQPVPFDLNEATRELAELFRPLIGEQIEVTLDLDPAAGEVLADPSQMEQVLMNLVINARDAMPTGGRLTIETSRVEVDERMARNDFGVPAGSHVLLTVRDEGEGIPPGIVHQIFDPFFTTKPHGVGTGLGLSTVYGVVKQSRGAIFVDSRLGFGTAFRIYLPRVGDVAPERKIPAEFQAVPQPGMPAEG